MKKKTNSLAGRYVSNFKIFAETITYVEDCDKFFYLEGVKKLVKVWTKFMELKKTLRIENFFCQKTVFHSKSRRPIHPPLY